MFFDGHCGLCNRFVTFLLARDSRRVLRYAPLQGETAARTLDLAVSGKEQLRTVVYQDAAGLHIRSTAALRILTALGGPWRAAAVLRMVPRPIRDAVYDFVARHRVKWFGRRDICRVPTAAEREWFLP